MASIKGCQCILNAIIHQIVCDFLFHRIIIFHGVNYCLYELVGFNNTQEALKYA